MRKIFIGLAVLVLFLAIDAVVARRMHPTAHSMQEALQQSQGEIAAQILVHTMKLRLDLPKKVDDITQLEDISAQGSIVTYHLSIDADRTEFEREMHEITDNLHKNGCERPDYRKLLGVGLTVVISIRSRDGVKGEPISFSPHDCGLDK